MAQATWNGPILAESNDVIEVEGNLYFPPDSIHADLFEKSDHTTVCSWKGVASYYTIRVGNDTNKNAAWSYPEPKAKAAQIKGYIAFWRGVKVSR